MKKKFIIIAIFNVLWILAGCSSPVQENEPYVEPDSSTDVFKISTASSGIYRIPLDDIGWQDVPWDDIALTHRGEPVPYWTNTNDESDQELYFFASGSDSDYTADQIFILHRSLSNSTRSFEFVPFKDDEQSNPINYSYTTKVLEENSLYDPLMKDISPWMWTKIIAPKEFQIETDFPHLLPDLPGALTLRLFGNTQAPADPDHHVTILVNGSEIGDTTWDGQTSLEYSTEVPENIFVTGKNTITVKLPGDTGSVIDIVYLDNLEITYPLEIGFDEQLFINGSGQHIELVSAPQDLTVLDITDPNNLRMLEPPVGEDVTIFAEQDHRYLLADPSNFLLPEKTAPFETADTKIAEDQPYDYIVITTSQFMEAASRLTEYRSQQGYSPLMISVDALYDHYNHGYPEPIAIQTFIQQLSITQNSYPDAILIVGDATYDPLGNISEYSSTMVPSMPVFSTYGGWTVSDSEFTDIDQDSMPDIPIGRIPAADITQLNTYIDKLVRYEELIQQNEPWQNRVFAVADGQEARFETDAGSFIGQFDDAFQTEILSTQPDSDSASQEIADRINDGYWITSYFGHGSLNMWGKDNLLNTDTVSGLQNVDHPTIVINMTCLTGYFIHPRQTSLAETFIFQDGSGAIAMLAPTSPTLASDQQPLSLAIGDQLQIPENYTIGQVLVKAWDDIQPEEMSSLDVIQTFILFGDPLLRIKPLP